MEGYKKIIGAVSVEEKEYKGQHMWWSTETVKHKFGGQNISDISVVQEEKLFVLLLFIF